MATETKKIIVRKGLSAQLPDLDEGEPGFATDTQKLYVGTSGTANIELSKEGHTHAISNVTNLQTTLDGKAASSHTHTISDVTNLQTALDAKATPSDITTAINNLVASAPGALNTLDELAAALGDDANFATTVTNALAGKAATSHTHAINNITDLQTTLDGKAASSHTHTLANITNAGTIASINLNSNGAQFLKGDGTFGIPTVAAGTAEWSYIGGTTVSTNGTIVVDSTVISGGFDLGTYDYKFSMIAETDAEDNSEVYIRFNNSSSLIYKSMYTRASADGNTTLVYSESNPSTTLIRTGLLLPGGNTGVAHTNIELEFILFRSYQAVDLFGTLNYNYAVRGQGSATSFQAPVSNTIFPLLTTFVGNIGGNASAVTSLEITHEITAGINDTAKVRVYRRAK